MEVVDWGVKESACLKALAIFMILAVLPVLLGNKGLYECNGFSEFDLVVIAFGFLMVTSGVYCQQYVVFDK